MNLESQFSATDSSAFDIDWQQLNQLSEGNSEFELELLQMFIEDLPTYIEEIKVALNREDLVTVNRLAHQIKGSSGNLGAKKLQNLGADLEKMAQEDNAELIKNTIPKLERGLIAIEQIIREKYADIAQ
jgi:histidine phosphotransfer protein HptB